MPHHNQLSEDSAVSHVSKLGTCICYYFLIWTTRLRDLQLLVLLWVYPNPLEASFQLSDLFHTIRSLDLPYSDLMSLHYQRIQALQSPGYYSLDWQAAPRERSSSKINRQQKPGIPRSLPHEYAQTIIVRAHGRCARSSIQFSAIPSTGSGVLLALCAPIM